MFQNNMEKYFTAISRQASFQKLHKVKKKSICHKNNIHPPQKHTKLLGLI